jgi:DNA-binding NarL/FixJ family response regulator
MVNPLPTGAAGLPDPEGDVNIPAEAVPAPPVRLLLVDDEPGLRTAVKAYLEDEGFLVTTANDGEEGWTTAQTLLPDVVITDVMMPRCDGYGLLKRLRGDERLGGTPVIFLTAKGMTADRIAGFQAAPDVKLDFTPREASVLQLVAEGMMNKEIARRLETSIRNVEKYVSRLFIKTGTASRTELVRYSLEHGLVD